MLPEGTGITYSSLTPPTHPRQVTLHWSVCYAAVSRPRQAPSGISRPGVARRAGTRGGTKMASKWGAMREEDPSMTGRASVTCIQKARNCCPRLWCSSDADK